MASSRAATERDRAVGSARHPFEFVSKTSRRRSRRTCSPRTRTANGSQIRDSGFLYTSGPDAVVFGGRGTRDCATTDTIASTHLGEIDHKLADLAALRRESAALDALCDGGTGGQCRILEAVAPLHEGGRPIAARGLGRIAPPTHSHR